MCTQINRPAGYNRGTHRYDQQQMSPAVFLYPHIQTDVADGQCDDDQVDFCAVLDMGPGRVLCHRLMASSSDPFSFSSIAGQYNSGRPLPLLSHLCAYSPVNMYE